MIGGEHLAIEQAGGSTIDRLYHHDADHASQNYFWPLRSLRPLIEYKLDPTERNKMAARRALNPPDTEVGGPRQDALPAVLPVQSHGEAPRAR